MSTSDAAAAVVAMERTSVRPQNLIETFHQYRGKIKTLSLDCFDTILWRRTSTPHDVFFSLMQHPLFLKHGITASMRMSAEDQAYMHNQLRHGYSQATLHEIYQILFPSADSSLIHELAATELEYEKNACYPFEPMLALMQEAASNGCQIIIVSDIYYTREQLTELLQHCLPQEVFKLINDIFVSCEYHTGKPDKLFDHVLKKLNSKPDTVLHLGDNPIADGAGAKKRGIHALHFLQYDSALSEILRLQTISSNFVETTLRNKKGHLNYFGGLLAEKLDSSKPEDFIGYGVMGTVMFCFAYYIQQKYLELKNTGKNPVVLFLMRDGYLPAMAFSALSPDIKHHHARISRFSSIASSFRNEADIIDYLSQNVRSGRYEDMCKQLLLPAEIFKKICTKLKMSLNPNKAFVDEIKKPAIQSLIIKNSAQYRERFKVYLTKHLGINPNDSIMFIDLGYQGTAQGKLTPVLRDEMNIEIYGYYLLALPSLHCTPQHQGLMDHRQFDERAISMLVTHIAVIEQLCTLPDKSVIDYDATGKPLFADTHIDESQFDKIKPIHEACIQFIHDAKQHIMKSHTPFTDNECQQIAYTSLSRLIFLPTIAEINYLKQFKHDVNLGTNEVLTLFDVNKGLQNLRRRSWLYSMRESSKSMRMNYPAELRAANIELSFMLMSQHRFGFEVASNDLSLRQEKMVITAFINDNVEQMQLDALLTHDGFFSVIIPVLPKCELGLQFGVNYQFVEIESAEMIPLASLNTANELDHTIDASNNLALHELKQLGGGLFECETPVSALIFVPPANLKSDQTILRVVFRPTVRRDDK